MKRDHNHDHTRVTNGQCTCAWPTSRYPTFGLDPDCPKHGTEAMLQLADQELDIDTSYPREERQ